MRLGGLTVILALLLGAVPALAQDSPGIMPKPAQPPERAKATHVRKHVAPKIAAPATVSAKTAALKTEATETEPSAEMSAALSDSERLKIQAALLWSGDYTGSIGGEDAFLSIAAFTAQLKSRGK